MIACSDILSPFSFNPFPTGMRVVVKSPKSKQIIYTCKVHEILEVNQ